MKNIANDSPTKANRNLMLNGFYFLSKSNIKSGKIDKKKKEMNDISHQYSLLFEQSNKKMFKLS